MAIRPNTSERDAAQSKTLPWFRFYHETLDDPKVQRLDGATFKHWVNILCVAARNGGRLPANPDLAFALRIDEIALETLLERLLIAGLIEVRNGGVNGSHIAPHGWDKRQYKSDTSSDRVKRYRQRFRNSDVTPPDTETDTETEEEKNIGRTRPVLCPDGVDQETFRDFKRQRKTTFTHTAMERFAKEAERAGWPLQAAFEEAVARGWQSFKADWVKSNGRTEKTPNGKRNGIADALDREIGFGESAGTAERRAIGGSGAHIPRAIAGPAAG